jgi:hypothetical protein
MELVNPLKLKLVSVILNDSVRTSKRTQHFTITMTNWNNSVQGDNRCLNRESYKTHECKMQSDWWSKQLVDIFTIRPLKINEDVCVENFGFRTWAASSIWSCLTFRRTLQLPSSEWRPAAKPQCYSYLIKGDEMDGSRSTHGDVKKFTQTFLEGFCKYGKKPSGRIKGKKFIYQLGGHKLVKNLSICSLFYDAFQ